MYVRDENGRYYDPSNIQSIAAARLAHHSFQGAQARQRREARAAKKTHWWNRKHRAALDAADKQTEADGLSLLRDALTMLSAQTDKDAS